jgi:hypothetical protein
VVSRLPPPTERPVQTRFRFGSAAERLNLADDGKSPDHYAKGTPSPLGQQAVLDGLRPLVGMWFQVLSLPLSGFFSPFARATGALSVAREYLALRDGPRGFRPPSTWTVLLRCRIRLFPLPRTGLSPAVVELSRTVPLGYSNLKHRSYNPPRTSPEGLG